MYKLHYMGHPFFDVGLATIVAHARKERPEDLEMADLESVAKFIEDNYTQQPLTSFLTVSLPNSDFTQPAFKDNPERRRAYAHLVARSIGPDVLRSEEMCVFTGLPALGRGLSLTKELPPGRAYRQHIPLITGENVINFSPWGDPGMPVSGEALLCLQFFPMGCLKCNGRLLAIHSDNPEILLMAAREALHKNKEAITLARANGETKMQDASPSPQTLLVETILEMDRNQGDAYAEKQPYSITAYHLSNSGQSSALDEKSPPLSIYHLPMSIVRFLHKMHHPDYRPIWHELERRGWERAKPDKGKTKPKTKEVVVAAVPPKRNFFYEDLLRLPSHAHGFVMTYLLRVPKRKTFQGDPRREYNLRHEANLLSWISTALFLKEVIHMEKERIDEIRDLGDRLANYVIEQNDNGFFRNFYKVRQAGDFRSLLLRANYKHVKAGHAPLIVLEPYIRVFEDGYEMMSPNWRFARDLVLIRMIEQLYQKDWFGSHPDALPDSADIDTNIEDTIQQ